MYECHSFHLTAGQASGSLQALNVKQMLHVSFTVSMEHKALQLFYSVLYLVQGK